MVCRYLTLAVDGLQINTEWADYTSPELPWTDVDKTLDAASRYPGEHHFEKMTSGLYMAELVRLILVRFVMGPEPSKLYV
jgi:hexokinase